jgi:hypothetical protein
MSSCRFLSMLVVAIAICTSTLLVVSPVFHYRIFLEFAFCYMVTFTIISRKSSCLLIFSIRCVLVHPSLSLSVYILRCSDQWLELVSFPLSAFLFLFKFNVCLYIRTSSFKSIDPLLFLDYNLGVTAVCNSNEIGKNFGDACDEKGNQQSNGSLDIRGDFL